MTPKVVIVATTKGGETLTSKPMPRVVAEMLLVLGSRRGGVERAELREVKP